MEEGIAAMMEGVGSNHPIRSFFSEIVHDSLSARLGLKGVDAIEAYLTNMLIKFIHDDQIYALRDLDGRPLRDVVAMLEEGDVCLNADSFDRERQVHQHIGDFALFWAGLYPEYVQRYSNTLLDYRKQGKESYYVVSTFEFGSHCGEAPLFRKLSEEFDALCLGLHYVRSSLPGLRT